MTDPTHTGDSRERRKGERRKHGNDWMCAWNRTGELRPIGKHPAKCVDTRRPDSDRRKVRLKAEFCNSAQMLYRTLESIVRRIEQVHTKDDGSPLSFALVEGQFMLDTFSFESLAASVPATPVTTEQDARELLTNLQAMGVVTISDSALGLVTREHAERLIHAHIMAFAAASVPVPATGLEGVLVAALIPLESLIASGDADISRTTALCPSLKEAIHTAVELGRAALLNRTAPAREGK